MNHPIRFAAATALLAAVGLVPTSLAQKEAKEAGSAPSMDDMMALYEKAGAVNENHRLLETFVGEWTTLTKMSMDPAAPPMEMSGTASAKAIYDGRFVQMVHRGDFMGQPFEGVSTTGYDNVKKKFVGSWLESTATSITLVEGSYDAGKKTFTFAGTSSDPVSGGPKAFRFTLDVSNPDRHLFSWYEPKDGKEHKAMETVYTRKKGA